MRDVWARLDTCKSQITSTFGNILKIDSTKKILRKLSGKVRHTASWVTNVSNSYGEKVNEGFEDYIDETIVLPTEDIEEQIEDKSDDISEVAKTCRDSFGIPGWDKVDKLAQALLETSGISLCDSDALEIIELYGQLEEYDKKPIAYEAVERRPASWKFQQRRRAGFVDVLRMSKSFVSGTTPAVHPTKSRLVEAILIHLCQRITSPGKRSIGGEKPKYVSRWNLIIQQYKMVRSRLVNSEKLLGKTGITLFMINETTLRTWHQKKRED